MTAKVILSPYANRWKARKRWLEAEAALKKAGVDFSFVEAQYKGQPVELAEKAVMEGFFPIIAAGGDGTLGEVVNGIGRAKGSGHLGVLGVIPLGSANDFASNLGIPLDLEKAARAIAGHKTRTIDVCTAGDTLFINNSAIGLEPYITVLEKAMTFFKGIPRYLAAALKGIAQNPCWEAKIEWDGGSYEGPLTLISVGNAPRTGGLFFMAPHADPSDGLLTAVLVFKKTALGLLLLLPKAMKPEGTYLADRAVREIHAKKITVQLQSPSPAHADGELFSGYIDSIEYGIKPGMIDVLVP